MIKNEPQLFCDSCGDEIKPQDYICIIYQGTFNKIVTGSVTFEKKRQEFDYHLSCFDAIEDRVVKK